jgi:hypothetical protein
MAFMYSADRKKVELSLSPDDIAVRFEAADLTTMAVRSARAALTADSALHEHSPRGYGRVMLLHQPSVTRTAFAAVRDALPTRFVRAVRRTAPVYIEHRSGLRLISTREITVRFRPKSTEGSQAKLLSSFGLTRVRVSEFDATQQIVKPIASVDETIILDLANRLSEEHPLVEYAAPNFISEHRKTAMTRDPLLAQQWHLQNAGQRGGTAGEDVRAFQAWDIIPGGSPDVVIAIVDDGVDVNHPDLKANIWTNPDPAAPDRHGRNFYDDNYDPTPRYFHPPYDQLEGNDNHGTPCAGVAAAVSNRRGGVGLAYNCKILPVKIFGADNLASNDRVANALRYAAQHAQIISCSWEGPLNPDLQAAITDVTKSGRKGKGCLVFCATGNEAEANIGFPASHPEAFGIGASNDLGKRAQYSNYGKGIDFVAPSSDPVNARQGITTTDVSRRNRGFNLTGEYSDSFGGTSSATPLAAAVAALVISVRPHLTRTEVQSILRKSADKIDRPAGGYQQGYSLQYGYGRLNAYAAVAAAQNVGARPRRSRKKATVKARGRSSRSHSAQAGRHHRRPS